MAQPHPAPSTTAPLRGDLAARLVPAWRTRRVAGVDAVAGDPHVPLSVWYAPTAGRPVAADAPGDGWPAWLACQTLAGLVSPGDLVVDLDRDDALRVAAMNEQCRYLPVGDEAAPRHLGHIAGQARLVALRWPRHADPAADAPAEVHATVDLLRGCRLLLAGDGYVAVALIPPPGDRPFADPAGPVLAAAPAAGLGYLQHLVWLDPPLVGDRVAVDPAPPPRPQPDGRHRRVHRDVVVLVLRVARHA